MAHLGTGYEVRKRDFVTTADREPYTVWSVQLDMVEVTHARDLHTALQAAERHCVQAMLETASAAGGINLNLDVPEVTP